MKILVSNDDGVHAPGIHVLAKYMGEIADIAVVAPDRNRTAASHSLTLHNPLRVTRMDNGFLAVSGTPTDCVHLAVSGNALDIGFNKPDMVVSGINLGENLGDDVFYSGTVAAAMEGRTLGFPSIAVSLVRNGRQDFEHFESAGKITQQIVKMIQSHPLPPDTILSINVPDLPYADIKGVKVCRLGSRHISEKVIRQTDPAGQEIFWIGPAGEEHDAGEGTDFHAIREGYATVTPLHLDMTKHALLADLRDWMSHYE